MIPDLPIFKGPKVDKHSVFSRQTDPPGPQDGARAFALSWEERLHMMQLCDEVDRSHRRFNKYVSDVMHFLESARKAVLFGKKLFGGRRSLVNRVTEKFLEALSNARKMQGRMVEGNNLLMCMICEATSMRVDPPRIDTLEDSRRNHIDFV